MAGFCACYFSAARQIQFFTGNGRGYDCRYGLDFTNDQFRRVIWQGGQEDGALVYRKQELGIRCYFSGVSETCIFSQESNTYNSLRLVAYGIGIKTPHRQQAGSLKNQLIYGIEKVGPIRGPVSPHYFPTCLRDLLAEFSWIAVD